MITGPQKILTKWGDDFHTRVGQCITEWARVDEVLFRAFQWCVGPYVQSAIIYYRTPGIEGRRALTDELVKSVLPRHGNGEQPHEHLRAWRDLDSRIQKALATRRRIAHHPAQLTEGEAMQPGDPPRPTGFAIAESMAEQQRGRGPKAALKIGDLTAHVLEVSKIADDLHSFWYYDLPKHSGEPPRQLPPPPMG